MLRAVWLLLLVYITAVVAKKDKPDIAKTKFDSVPVNLFYFEDSDVVILQDLVPEIVYRSTDAGASWKKITGIESDEGLRIWPHPYNNKIAVAMSMGRKHYITKDQGETWTDFETEFEPMMRSQPVVFHGSNPDKIIFLTSGCNDKDCTGQVCFSPPTFKPDMY